MFLSPIKLKTARLVIRDVVKDDCTGIFNSYAQDMRVTKYLSWKAHRSIDETRMYVNTCLSENQSKIGSCKNLIIQIGNDIAGMVRLESSDGAKIDYVLAENVWRKGYMYEALSEIISFLSEQYKVLRYWAYCDFENEASASLLKKIGMKEEKVLHNFLITPNISTEPRTIKLFSMRR